MYLIINDLPDIPILYLSSYINKYETNDYRLLNKANRSDEWEEYILYILSAIEITANRMIEKINAVNNLLSETISIVQLKEPKLYKKELVELLFEQPYSKIEYVCQKLNAGRKAASRYLNSLEAIGIVSLEKIRRENVYINRKPIEILKMH